jgi:hypothetical protein
LPTAAPALEVLELVGRGDLALQFPRLRALHTFDVPQLNLISGAGAPILRSVELGVWRGSLDPTLGVLAAGAPQLTRIGLRVHSAAGAQTDVAILRRSVLASRLRRLTLYCEAPPSLEWLLPHLAFLAELERVRLVGRAVDAVAQAFIRNALPNVRFDASSRPTSTDRG